MKLFDGAKTGGDIVRICQAMSEKKLSLYRDVLEDMNNYFGLTMRDEYILTIITMELKYKNV